MSLLFSLHNGTLREMFLCSLEGYFVIFGTEKTNPPRNHTPSSQMQHPLGGKVPGGKPIG